MSPGSHHFTLEDLSARFQLELRGERDRVITGVGTLEQASESQISFLANVKYRSQLDATRAGAVILRAEDAEHCPTNCLVAKDPYLAYARLAVLFDPRPAPRPGIHPSAVIDPSARLGRDVSIAPNAVIGPDCVVGDRSVIGPCTVLDSHVTIGQDCRLYSNISLGYGVRLGDRVIVHSGAVIGADGFGIAFATDHWEKVPQLGNVVIGSDCEIGANATIDRGAIGDTVLEDDVRTDNQVHIAHNAFVGAHTAMAGQSGVSGSGRVGRYCLLAGRAGVAGHIEIADRTTVAALSVIFNSVSEPGTTWSSQLKAQPLKDWQRNVARLRKLDDLARRLAKIENNLEKKTNG